MTLNHPDGRADVLGTAGGQTKAAERTRLRSHTRAANGSGENATGSVGEGAALTEKKGKAALTTKNRYVEIRWVFFHRGGQNGKRT